MSLEKFGDDFYQEVSEVLNIFKNDLEDHEVSRIHLVLNHSDRFNSHFLNLFKSIFTQLISTQDQKLIISYFKEAFDGSKNIFETGEKMFTWSKINF